MVSRSEMPSAGGMMADFSGRDGPADLRESVRVRSRLFSGVTVMVVIMAKAVL